MRINAQSSFRVRHFAFLWAFCLGFLFSLFAATPAGAQSAIALVQHASKDAGSTALSTLGFPSNNTAGNWIGVCIRAGALNETIAVSDSRGNTYRKAVQFNQTVDGFTFAIYYAENISVGANTVTVSDNLPGTLRFAIFEYSGIATSGSLDVAATAQGRGTLPSTAPAVTTTANGDLVLGAITTGNGQNFTAGSGYAIRESVPGLPNSKMLVEDQVQSTAGATLANASMGGTDDWGAGLATFKAAGGTGGNAPTITALNPSNGAVGTSIVITGTNFGTTQGSSTVNFNGVLASPTAWGAASITAPVPTNATTGNVIVTVNGLASNGVPCTVNQSPSVTINQAAGQGDPASASPINFTVVFSTAVTGFSSAGVNLSGTAGATTASVTGSGATYNVAVSGMTQSGTVIASIPAGVATANGLSNAASTSTDNTVTFNIAAPSVTINQAASQTDPTNGSTINFTAVFSTAVTGFTNSGVNLGGIAGANAVTVTGSGTTYNVAVSGMAQSGTVIATIPVGVASANGVFNTASTSTDNTATYDITAPSVTVNQASGQGDPASTAPINFTAVFSEAVTGFSNVGVTLGGTAGATTASVSGSGTTYNIAVSGMTQTGTVIVSIPAAKATDLAGNSSTASTSTDNTVTFNFSALPGPVASYSFEEGTGTTTADASGNNNTGTLSAGVTWTAGKTGNAVLFGGSSGDITINDSPSLDLNGSFTLSGWVKPATVGGVQTILIKETTSGCGYFLQIANGQIDSGFNNGSSCVEHIATNASLIAGNWYYLTAVLDRTGKTYSTYLNGNLLASVTENGAPVPNTQALVLGRSGCSGCGFERLNGVLDELKIYNRALSAAEVQAVYNVGLAVPTITALNPATGGVGTPVVITGTNFGATQGSSTVKFNGVLASPTAWGATSITAPVPTGATTGNVIITVNGTASNGVAFTVPPPPSVTINQASGQADPTNGSTINFTAVFSTAVTGFTISGVNLGGTAGAATVVVTGSGTTYNVAVSGMPHSGTVIATIPAGVASANGVFNTASTSTDNTITYDITSPSVTVNQAASQGDPASAAPINFTAVFSEAVTGFSGSGVTLGGTAGATTASVSGSGATYNIAVSGMTQTGIVIVSIGVGKATDAAGNSNTASTSTDNTVTFNIAAPSVTINQAASQTDPTNGSTINFTAVFSTAVTGFTNSGVNLGGTAGANAVTVTGSGTTYNVAVSGMTQSGTVIATIPAGVASANGVFNTASTSANNAAVYDITSPSVTVNQAASQVDPTSATTINFTAAFSENVTGFTGSDVTLGGTAGATTATVTGSGATYNVAVTGMTQLGTVIVSIAAGKATDLAGNVNTASTSADNTVTFNGQSGLVASYSFEEGTGTTAADSSGNNNTGTLSAGVTWTTGKTGSGVSFNGSSGDITINEAASLDLNGSFTLSGWVKPATVNGVQTVLIKETTSGCGYFLQITNGQIDSGFNNGVSCVEHVTTSANLVAGNWNYITTVLNHSSNSYSTYVNGSLISIVGETGVSVPNTQPLVLGRSGCSSCGFERLNGVLDEVRIYNRALSAVEVQALYNAGLNAPTIGGLNPTTGATGTPVTITGTNFGAAQGSSTVKFNGVLASPTAWNATSITAPVPNGATTGNVVVTVNGIASNGVPFNVISTSLTVTISPKRAGVTLAQPQQFTGTVFNDPLNGGVSWSVDGIAGGSPTNGTVSSTGLFTPGTQAGVHLVTATSNSNPSVSATATVAVTDLPGMFTYRYDNGRTGQNVQEYALNTSNVNTGSFGALFTCPVDGYLYAAPLYVANMHVGGQTHNVVFVATEHDSVYAFDADSPSCVQLWHASFLSTGVTTVAPADVNEPVDLIPEIGITSTPAIDPASATIYVMAKTKETVGTGCSTASPCLVHRLHALDLTTGAEKLGGPIVVSGPNFNPVTHLQRAALLLNNGTVYVAIGSHGDNGTWQGWMMAYNATTLAQKWVYHTSNPINGNNGGAIWGSGNGPAADASGNIYFETGNGFFDGVNNFSDSVLKISPNGTRVDFFTPFDQQIMQDNDIDLGSSNPIILPDSVGSPAHPHLLIATGKIGVIYLLDQTNMGGYNPAGNQDVEEVTIAFNTTNLIQGFFGQPAYWNGNLYSVVVNDVLRQFPIVSGNISNSSSSQSSNIFTFRSGTPVVSASGTTNGIVWIVDAVGYRTSTPAILYAYDANNVGTLLYSSPSSGTGTAPVSAKFTVPTVANGKIYVGGQYAFTVFGLLPN